MPPSITRRSTSLSISALVLGVLAAWLICWWWARPPQMGTDSEVFKAVDALFTAVTARDEKLLARCELQLASLNADRKLKPKAHAYLSTVIATARSGSWESAARTLYDFMRAQRRT